MVITINVDDWFFSKYSLKSFIWTRLNKKKVKTKAVMFNSCAAYADNFCILNAISFKLRQLTCEMHMKKSYKFDIIPVTQSPVIKEVQDLLGQPLYWHKIGTFSINPIENCRKNNILIQTTMHNFSKLKPETYIHIIFWLHLFHCMSFQIY